MHPITLRLPTDLLSELDEEADEAGFSSRSEYIRHLLQNRKDASELFSSEAESTSSEHASSTDVVDTVDELSGDLTAMEDRVDALEETVGQIQSEMIQTGDTPEQSDTTEEAASSDEPQEERSAEYTTHAHNLDALNHWLQTDGPDSDDAQAVVQDAARILTDQGPLSASDLREQLFERHPDAYSSADTLWKSTIQRLYEDAPGFSKPKYGTYMFGEN